MMTNSSFSDLSSIESSTCRINKNQAEVISVQKAMILSLTDAVNRLACTLQTKEDEIKVRDRTESDLESKNLDLMIENTELKNRIADLQDGMSSNQHQSTKLLTTFSTEDDGWIFPYENSCKPYDYQNDEPSENGHRNPQDAILSPPNIRRRKSMMNLSNLNIASRFRKPVSSSVASSRFNTAQSLFTSVKGKRLAWKDKRLTLIPRHIFFHAELVPVSDEVSDVSA